MFEEIVSNFLAFSHKNFSMSVSYIRVAQLVRFTLKPEVPSCCHI